MNKLQVGYAKVNINPILGIGVYGYYVPRYAKGFLDDLEASAIAVSDGSKTILLFAVDTGAIAKEIAWKICEEVEKATGVPKENVFISASHTHTSPFLRKMDMFDAPEGPILEYREFFIKRLVDAAVMALDDIKPAVMGHIVGKAPDRIAYIRRYKMKDGSTMTCPPIDDPRLTIL